MDDENCIPPDNSQVQAEDPGPPPNILLDEPPQFNQIGTSNSVTKPRYDPHLIPFDPVLAKGHSVTLIQTAKRVANFQKKLEEDDEDEENYCPCCGNPLNAEKFPLTCSISLLSELGEGIPLYYHLIKWVIIGFLVATFLSAIFCLKENYAENRISEWSETMDGNVMLEGSLANYGRTGEPSLTQPWLHVGCIWMLFVLHQYLLNTHKRMCASMDRGVITPSDYTCMVTKLPRTLDVPDFITTMEQRSGSKISKVNLAYNIGGFLKVQTSLNSLKTKKNKYVKILALDGELPRSHRCLICPGPRESMEQLDASIQQTESSHSTLKSQINDQFTGIAFVTFEQDESKT